MHLVHWKYEFVDVLLPVGLVTALKVVLEPTCAPATRWALCLDILIDGAVLEWDDMHVHLVISMHVDQLGDKLDVQPTAVWLRCILNDAGRWGWHTHV